MTPLSRSPAGAERNLRDAPRLSGHAGAGDGPSTRKQRTYGRRSGMARMGASMNAVIVAVLAAVMMGPLAPAAPAAQLRYGMESPPATDAGAGGSRSTTLTPDGSAVIFPEGIAEVTVKGPGTVATTVANTCTPTGDSSSTEATCDFIGDAGTTIGLSQHAFADAHTSGRFVAWSGCTSLGPGTSCRVLLAANTINLVTAEFVDDHPASLNVTNPADNQLVISASGAVPIAWSADEAVSGASCQVDRETTRPCSTSDSVTVSGAAGDPTLHTLVVTAKDRWAAAGLGTTSSLTRTWREYVTQATTITGGPADGASINTQDTK